MYKVWHQRDCVWCLETLTDRQALELALTLMLGIVGWLLNRAAKWQLKK